jgi:hypothetical protein
VKGGKLGGKLIKWRGVEVCLTRVDLGTVAARTGTDSAHWKHEQILSSGGELVGKLTHNQFRGLVFRSDES